MDYFPFDQKALIKKLGKDFLISQLKAMITIRNFELRAEGAYLQGKIGGFFHSYMGQEAIQTAAISAMGRKNWWAASYRCHAMALLLGESPNSLMAELLGRSTGNAKGRGGSMHFYSERMLGGFGIVAGQIPISTGAGFAIKYKEIKDEVSVCFFGDGAVAQGTFHESLNMASLWNLPCIYVIENNHWGMGTAIEKAVSVKRLAEDKASSFNMKGYTFDGMDFFSCYAGFEQVHQEVLKTGRPVLVECVTERFRGHSISDPGHYRSKEDIKKNMERDPLLLLKNALIEAKFLTEEEYKAFDKESRDHMMQALKFAEESPWPELTTLEEDVYARS